MQARDDPADGFAAPVGAARLPRCGEAKTRRDIGVSKLKTTAALLGMAAILGAAGATAPIWASTPAAEGVPVP